MKQLQVTGYPTVFIQAGEIKFVMVARGYTEHTELRERIENVLKETGT